MPSTPPDQVSRLEALVGRLDPQPLLTRRAERPAAEPAHAPPSRPNALSFSFLRGAGLPVGLHLPAFLVLGVLDAAVDASWSHHLFQAVCLVAFPVLEALSCLVVAQVVVRRRTAQSLGKGFRSQARFLGLLLTLGTLFGTGVGFWEATAVAAVGLLALLAPGGTRPDDGRPWWADAA